MNRAHACGGVASCALYSFNRQAWRSGITTPPGIAAQAASTSCCHCCLLPRKQGALEDAATAAQHQLGDCRLALAASESHRRLAHAAAEAVSTERKQLMSQLAQEMNKSTLFEQVKGTATRMSLGLVALHALRPRLLQQHILCSFWQSK